MTDNKLNVTCPTCGKKDTWKTENAFRPFCSDRCKLIDLGDWASEKNRIAGDEASNKPDEDSEEN